MKVSIVIPVYYNEDNLYPLYADIKEKFIDKIDYDYEIVMVNDGSKDRSYEVMQELADQDPNIKIVSLSRNFGSHAAILCGLEKCTGDCAVVKAADLQEPTELILKMVESWKQGNNVVLAVRQDRKKVLEQNCLQIHIIGWSEKRHCPICQKVDLMCICWIRKLSGYYYHWMREIVH